MSVQDWSQQVACPHSVSMIILPTMALPAISSIGFSTFPVIHTAGTSRNRRLYYQCAPTAEERSNFFSRIFCGSRISANITPLLQAWSAAVITEYPQWLLISQVGFSIALFTALFIIQSASLFKKSEYIPRLLMAAFYINCVYTALTVIGLIITL